MTNSSACVDGLADLVGWTAGSSFRFDWPAVEASLGGLALPADYKALVERFPPGKFRELIKVIRPGDVNSPPTEYLGYYAHRLEDMRKWRAGGHAIFPYPIYPEPDGLLPWAEGPRGELCFWLTGPGDPDGWQVVTADNDFLEWQSFSGTACEFLTAVVSGTVPNPFDSSADVSMTTAAFRAIGAAQGSSKPPPKVTSVPRWGRNLPANEFDELATVLAEIAPPPGRHDWAGLETQIGLPLPSDYTSFIDRFGTGIFCDIAIVGPDPCGEFDMVALLRDQAARAAATDRGGMTAFGSEPSGLIAWGRSADGWTFNWRLIDPDPNTWSTAMVSPEFQPVFLDELSFSSFLLRYCRHRDDSAVYFGRSPWQGGPTFTPHHHRPR